MVVHIDLVPSAFREVRLRREGEGPPGMPDEDFRDSRGGEVHPRRDGVQYRYTYEVMPVCKGFWGLHCGSVFWLQ